MGEMGIKYVQLVQDMYEGSETVVRCAAGTTESFKIKVGLHQGSALSPFLFAVIMDRLTDEVRREPPWTMQFADDIVICEETKEEVISAAAFTINLLLKELFNER